MLKEQLDILTTRIKERYDGQFTSFKDTKQELVLPFLSALGYDTEDKTEVVPDYVIQSSRLADYVIKKDGDPVMVVECTKFGYPLGAEQRASLVYCFKNIPTAKIGILTNGVQYLFYSDMTKEIAMDNYPFLHVYLLDPNQINHEALQYLTKAEFNIDTIHDSIKTTIKDLLVRQYTLSLFVDPPKEFIYFLIRELNLGFDSDTDRIKNTVKSTLTELLRGA